MKYSIIIDRLITIVCLILSVHFLAVKENLVLGVLWGISMLTLPVAYDLACDPRYKRRHNEGDQSYIKRTESLKHYDKLRDKDYESYEQMEKGYRTMVKHRYLLQDYHHMRNVDKSEVSYTSESLFYHAFFIFMMHLIFL